MIVIYEKSLGGPSGSIILPAPTHPVERPIIGVPLLSLRWIARRRRFTRSGTPVMAAAAAQCVPLRGSLLAPASPETAKVPASTPTSSAASASPPLRAAVAPSSGRRSGAPLRRRRARHRRISACLWRWKGEGLKIPAFLVLGLLIPLVFIPKGVSFLLLEDSRC